MEPFSMIQGTQIKVFALDEGDTTIVVTTSDSAHPERPAQTSYEQCENDAEAQAVVTKWVHDLQRQGWTLRA